MPLVSKFKRSDTWYLRYSRSIGFRKLSLRTGDEKLAEAIRLNEEHKHTLSRAGITKPIARKIRYSEFCKLFLLHCQAKQLAQNTLDAYFYALNGLGQHIAADLYVQKITPAIIEEYVTRRHVVGKGKVMRPAARKTIRNELIALSTALRWAVKNRYLNENPMNDVAIPKRIKYPPRYLRDVEYLSLKRIARGTDMADIIDFYLLTGIRRSDGPLVRIAQHVDMRLGIIQLPQEKSSDWKAFPITAELRPVLKRLIASAHGSDQLINRSADNLTRRFRKLAKDAGLPANITFHALRHTFGTKLASLGVGFRTIQEAMGHSDPDSTKQYVHAMEGEVVNALRKLKIPRSPRRN